MQKMSMIKLPCRQYVQKRPVHRLASTLDALHVYMQQSMRILSLTRFYYLSIARLHIGLLLAKVSSLTDLGSVTFCTQTALNPRSTRYEVGNGSTTDCPFSVPYLHTSPWPLVTTTSVILSTERWLSWSRGSAGPVPLVASLKVQVICRQPCR